LNIGLLIILVFAIPYIPKCQKVPIIIIIIIIRPIIIMIKQWHRDKCKSGGTCLEQSAGIKIFVVPSTFGSTSTIRRFGEYSRDGQYILVSFLFAVLLLMVSPCAQPFIKVGGTCPQCPNKWAPL